MILDCKEVEMDSNTCRRPASVVGYALELWCEGNKMAALEHFDFLLGMPEHEKIGISVNLVVTQDERDELGEGDWGPLPQWVTFIIV